ncbi:MAG: hypothetical protein Q4G68_13700 [Planctomycetia bacterium]|nr:hypothetical protein [Planctomycetia bacterium]
MNKTRVGITLVEVITAMALLGTLLVTLLVGFGRHMSQIERSTERLAVMAAAEELLTQWHLQFGFAPINESGEIVVGSKTYRFQTRPVEQMIDRGFLIGKISFEIFSPENDVPVLSLQLIVPSWESFE